MNIKINHLQHVGISVTDIESSEKFYQRLGFENVMTSTFAHECSEGRVMMMQHGTIIVELYQMPEPTLTEIRKRTNGKIDHVAFDVDDIDETYATLKADGFHIVEEAPVYLGFWQKGCKYLNILGPDGERLEFCQIL
ncbi:VOC family protein [Hymenobacter sp. NBH84]|uniref:VOC family protein n=1 Tax=Hymenobacter sp. NBH84 TaxID=2596915 RepID=UPI001625DA0A|nr:VOC family protein [Hymenobacter sp. NBH84]QNE40181.1 VOC family protein [Hymenobacter sp. NBH84]